MKITRYNTELCFTNCQLQLYEWSLVGEHVCDPNVITVEQWHHILTLPTVSKRRREFKYIGKIEYLKTKERVNTLIAYQVCCGCSDNKNIDVFFLIAKESRGPNIEYRNRQQRACKTIKWEAYYLRTQSHIAVLAPGTTKCHESGQREVGSDERTPNIQSNNDNIKFILPDCCAPKCSTPQKLCLTSATTDIWRRSSHATPLNILWNSTHRIATTAYHLTSTFAMSIRIHAAYSNCRN